MPPSSEAAVESAAGRPAARAAESAPLLSATGLVRAYGAVRVLRGVDLTLDAGETLAVVGPNGAGKTTLLRCLAGLARPSAGEVRVLGRRLERGDPETRRPIGLVSHHSLLYDDLTVLENVTFAARLYGLAEPERAARRMLEALDLADRAGEVPRRLSRGLLQRAAIARALVHDPRVVLLDEPFTGLDAPAAARFRALLAERVAGGRALVLVTHHLAEAWDLATRVGVLVGGRWAMEAPRPGSLEDFLPRYLALTGGRTGDLAEPVGG
ncbi:MAG TPA: heme ABC exporter ATP-binding protein CcmA [Gemmatimonadales bacterium]|nr:heme ABC exporter ATP-binding protein CcmA [Gemmatimonadales bacterium]